MNGERPGAERITLSRSAIQQMVHEGVARGYAEGRADEYLDVLARCTREPIAYSAFIRRAVARGDYGFRALWREMQDARDKPSRQE